MRKAPAPMTGFEFSFSRFRRELDKNSVALQRSLSASTPFDQGFVKRKAELGRYARTPGRSDDQFFK